MKFFFKTLKAQRQPYIGFLIFFLLMTAIAAGAEVVMTRLAGDMGEAALVGDTTVLLHFLLIVTGIFAIQALAAAASALFLGRFAGHAGYRFRDNFAKFFLRRPFSKFEGVNSGESLSVYSNDLPAAVQLVANGGLQMFANILTMLITFGYMLFINLSLTLIFFASFPVLIIMQVLISLPIQKKEGLRLKAVEERNAMVNDSLQNTSTVAAYSLENFLQKRAGIFYDKVVKANKSLAGAMLPLVLAGMLATMAPLLVVTAIAASRVIDADNAFTLAEFIAFLGLASNAGGFLSMLSQRQTDVQTNAAGAERLLNSTDGETEDLTTNGALPLTDIAIAANNLLLAYPSNRADRSKPELLAHATSEEENRRVLDNVSFEIKRGSKVAFVGGSGSGKSTVLKLLLGLYPATEGKMSLWGQNISDIPLSSLRESFSYVPQDSFLFPESILANITGDNRILDLERLEKSCRDAGILEFIESLPDKFNSVLNESAENISGGQKQRIALARAFYRDAPIILFDEATSSLDPTTEAEIFKSLSHISNDKTVIMVAHRSRAIDFCDQVITMENGRISEVRHDG